MQEIPKPATLAARGGVWFRLGEGELHLGIEEPFRPARKAHPAFEVADLEGLRQRLEKAGAPVRTDELLPGRRRFYTDDPFGNRLEFIQADRS